MNSLWIIIGVPAALTLVLAGVFFLFSLCAVAKKPLPPYNE